MTVDLETLAANALAARARADAKHSGFAVGAAVRGASGAIHTGANVESDSYGLSICAERVAMAAAAVAGDRRIEAIAVATDADPPATPCGACRQWLAERAAPDAPVLLLSTSGDRVVTTVGALLPDPFRI
jgi:cytidine deaminase